MVSPVAIAFQTFQEQTLSIERNEKVHGAEKAFYSGFHFFLRKTLNSRL